MFKVGDIVENTIDREFVGNVVLKAGEKGKIVEIHPDHYVLQIEGIIWVVESGIGGLSLVENSIEKKEETKPEIIQPKFIQGEIVSNNGEECEIIERYSFCINGEVLGYIYDIKGKNRIFTKVAEQNLNKIDKTVISKEKEVNDPDVDSYYESVHRLAVEIAKETTYTTAQIEDFIETCDNLHGDIEDLKKCIKIGTSTVQFYFNLLRKYGDKNLERVKKEQSIPKNPYWENIQKMAQKQRDKGISKYKQGLEHNTELDTLESITYLQEELIDALMYCEHLKAKVNKIKNL